MISDVVLTAGREDFANNSQKFTACSNFLWLFFFYFIQVVLQFVGLQELISQKKKKNPVYVHHIKMCIRLNKS